MSANPGAHKRTAPLSFVEPVVAAVFMLLLIVLLILLSPIIVPYFLYLYIRSKFDDRACGRYIRANEGARFFIYTSRKTSERYVRENILPFLPPDTRVVYLLDSRKPFSLGEELPYLEHFIYRVRRTPGGYPYVAKISKGKLLAISINRQLYSAITRKADADAVNKAISKFLESDVTGPHTRNAIDPSPENP
jgi:hypothetical protein